MRALTATDFTEKPVATVERVEIPSRGEVGYVRVMGGMRRELYLDMLRRTATDSKVAINGLLLAYSLCDESGNYLIPEPTIEHIYMVSEQDYDRLLPFFDKAAELNGFTKDAAEKVKNFSATRISASNSGSPDTSARPGSNSSVN